MSRSGFEGILQTRFKLQRAAFLASHAHIDIDLGGISGRQFIAALLEDLAYAISLAVSRNTHLLAFSYAFTVFGEITLGK